MKDRKQNRLVMAYLPLRTASGQLFSMCSFVCFLVWHKSQSLERAFFLLNKFVLLANWRIIALRMKMKMLCGSLSQTFCYWLIELHEHCCKMESMMVFCSLRPFTSSSILFLTNLSFGFFGLSWWRSVSASMFLGAVALYKSRISGFLDCLICCELLVD